jgi:hypothetical protein
VTDAGPDAVRASAHIAPQDVSEETIEAVGTLSEAFEYAVRARGHLYSFHQLIGRADFLAEDAVNMLRDAGHGELAERLQRDLVGRNVLDGRWTFQVVEEFDSVYYEPFQAFDRTARNELTGGVHHLYEARLKEQRRTHGRPHHEADPGD